MVREDPASGRAADGAARWSLAPTPPDGRADAGQSMAQGRVTGHLPGSGRMRGACLNQVSPTIRSLRNQLMVPKPSVYQRGCPSGGRLCKAQQGQQQVPTLCL